MARKWNRFKTRIRFVTNATKGLFSQRPQSVSKQKARTQALATKELFDFYRQIVLNEAKYFRGSGHQQAYARLQRTLLKPQYHPETRIIFFTGNKGVDSEIQLSMAAFREMVGEINDLKRQAVQAKSYAQKEILVLKVRDCEGIITENKSRIFLLISKFLAEQDQNSRTGHVTEP